MVSSFSGTLQLDGGVIKDRHVSNVAADRISVDKVGQLFKPGTCFGFVRGGTPTTREEIVYTATGAGTIRGFHGLFWDTGTSMGITFDLKKNGSSVLSAVVSFTHADTDQIAKDGTISGTSFVAGDILSIAMTVTTSTGCTGPYAWAVIDETYCPAS